MLHFFPHSLLLYWLNAWKDAWNKCHFLRRRPKTFCSRLLLQNVMLGIDWIPGALRTFQWFHSLLRHLDVQKATPKFMPFLTWDRQVTRFRISCLWCIYVRPECPTRASAPQSLQLETSAGPSGQSGRTDCPQTLLPVPPEGEGQDFHVGRSEWDFVNSTSSPGFKHGWQSDDTHLSYIASFLSLQCDQAISKLEWKHKSWLMISNNLKSHSFSFHARSSVKWSVR